MSDNATASSDFAIEVSDHGLGYNKPQQMGRKLWAPVWGMAIMAFPCRSARKLRGRSGSPSSRRSATSATPHAKSRLAATRPARTGMESLDVRPPHGARAAGCARA